MLGVCGLQCLYHSRVTRAFIEKLENYAKSQLSADLDVIEKSDQECKLEHLKALIEEESMKLKR